MEFVYWIAIWAVLACVVLALAGYRGLITLHEDDSIHLSDRESGLIEDQLATGRRLQWVDGWGKSLTVVTLVFGLALAVIYTYQSWIASYRPAP